jgi:EmrB/QacA subfamily drug resistance transporter
MESENRPVVTSEPDPGYKWRVLASVVVGLFMVILDQTVVNVALKALQAHFAVSTDVAQWVISLYTLTLGIATPLSGFLGDRFGAKRIYLSALILFLLGSLLCGISPSLPLLIVARAIQGVGGGIALPLGTALLFRTFPVQERGAAFGIFGVVLVFAPAVGPLVGGWLVDHNLLSWIFFINLPIGAVGLIIGYTFLRELPGSANVRADIPGILLACVGFGALLFATSIAGQQGVGWLDTRVIVGFMAGLLCLAAFVVVELRTEQPLLDLRLYTIPSFAIASIANTVGTIALFGAEFILPLYLQLLRGESAFQTGLILLPLAITSSISGLLAGRYADRFGPRMSVALGFVLMSYNTFQLAQIKIDTSIGFIVFLMAVRGFAVGMIIQNTQLAALLEVPIQRLNRATPLLLAMRQTMLSIGVAILATVLASGIMVSMPNVPAGGNLASLPETARVAALQSLHVFQLQYVTGLDRAYEVTFVVSLITTFLAIFLPGWPGKYPLHALQEPRFQESQLQEAQLREAQLREAQLLELQLQEAQLRDAQLQELQFQGARLQVSQFGSSQFRSLHFQKPFQITQAQKSQFQSLQSQKPQVQKSQFQGSQFQKPQIQKSQAQSSQFRKPQGNRKE